VNNRMFILICLIIAIALGVAGGVVVNNKNSYKNVSVSLGQNLQVGIYKDLSKSSNNSIYSYAGESPVLTISSSQTVKLKMGVYDFVVNDPTHQYENPVTKTTVNNLTNSVSINPTYSSQKLATMLQAEQASIQQALIGYYPSLPLLYTISNDRLYGLGEWYGARLTPIDPDIDDSVVVIMQETNNKWSVAAAPQISIAIPSNPTIPSGVIDSVDQL
jgi:hypothetical protein